MKRIKTLAGDVYMADEVDARIAEHNKAWEDAAKERVQHLARISELEKALTEVRDYALYRRNDSGIARDILTIVSPLMETGSNA